MNKLILTLASPIDTYDIVLDVLDTPIAKKWYDEINKNYEFYETHRFFGFPNSPNLKECADKINEYIDAINAYRPNTITLRANADMSVELTNKLHKYFEVLHGGALSNSDFLKNAPHDVAWALAQYNVYIHAYEKANLNRPMITCTFKAPRIPLADEDYDHFTYELQFGHAYINYCEVGKHLLELFEDDDDHCGEENIRPLKYYKADFKLKFGKSDISKDFIDRFEAWFDTHKEKFARLGIHRNKYRALGLITVAKVNYDESGFTNLSQEEIAFKISPYNKIHKIKCQ